MWQYFYYATCHNFEPSLIIIMNDGVQYFENKIIFYVRESSYCHMLDFNRWMTINDVNMTSWVWLLWSCIVVENELFW